MTAILITALFIVTATVVFLGLCDAAVRGHNAWRAIRREMALNVAGNISRDLPSSDAVVVEIRQPAARHATVDVVTQQPLAAAA